MFTYGGVFKWAVTSSRRRIVGVRDAIRCKRCRLLYKVVTLLWQGWGEAKGFPEPLEAWCLRAKGYIPHPSFLAPFIVVVDKNWEPLDSGARGEVF